jgi:hypothetical protein
MGASLDERAPIFKLCKYDLLSHGNAKLTMLINGNVYHRANLRHGLMGTAESLLFMSMVTIHNHGISQENK